MNREIKFRAWWGKDGGFDYFDLTNSPIDEGKEVPVMQFTGLKDRNGKDIYEGDVVHYKSMGWDWKLRVEFHDGGWCLTNSAMNRYELCKIAISSSMIFEIIGNIYENGELLN